MAAYSVSEVFAMAETSERNAAAFYRKAANDRINPIEGDRLMELCRMEEEHEKKFARLRQSVGNAAALDDPYGDAQLYLNAIVDLEGGEGSSRMMEQLKPNTPFKEIVRMGVLGESRAILFYTGIRDMLDAEEHKAIVQAIIVEERKHIITLQGLLTGNA